MNWEHQNHSSVRWGQNECQSMHPLMLLPLCKHRQGQNGWRAYVFQWNFNRMDFISLDPPFYLFFYKAGTSYRKGYVYTPVQTQGCTFQLFPTNTMPNVFILDAQFNTWGIRIPAISLYTRDFTASEESILRNFICKGWHSYIFIKDHLLEIKIIW